MDALENLKSNTEIQVKTENRNVLSLSHERFKISLLQIHETLHHRETRKILNKSRRQHACDRNIRYFEISSHFVCTIWSRLSSRSLSFFFRLCFTIQLLSEILKSQAILYVHLGHIYLQSPYIFIF